jgi:hypothetical protein
MVDRYCQYQIKQMKVVLEGVDGEVVPLGKLESGKK